MSCTAAKVTLSMTTELAPSDATLLPCGPWLPDNNQQANIIDSRDNSLRRCGGDIRLEQSTVAHWGYNLL